MWNPCYKWKFCHWTSCRNYGHFINKIWETKILTYLINKKIPIGEPVLQDALVFLVEAYLKLVLGYSSKVGYCEVDFYNVHIELCRVGTEIETILK